MKNLSEEQWMRISRNKHALRMKAEEIYYAPESASSEKKGEEELRSEQCFSLPTKE